MVATMNDIKVSQLDNFLFGSKRISLEPVKSAISDLQDGHCFYCMKKMASACNIDHFLPWARHANNSIDNLVGAHSHCNGRKSDFLADEGHVVNWRARSARHATALAQIAHDKRWESQPERILGVARAIYLMMPDDAPLWRFGGSFTRMNRHRIREILAV